MSAILMLALGVVAALAAVAPCDELGVHCCDLVAQYTFVSQKLRTGGDVSPLDIGCKRIDPNGFDVTVHVTARSFSKLIYNANDDLGAITEDSNGNRGVGVSAAPFAGAVANVASLLDAADEGFDISFNQFVRIRNIRLAAFTRRRDIDAALFETNSVQISCSRRGSGDAIFNPTGVASKTVSGDLDGLDVSLEEFGIVNFCTVRYASGPGFALSSVAWQPYAFVSHTNNGADIRKFIREELLKEEVVASHRRHSSSSD